MSRGFDGNPGEIDWAIRDFDNIGHHGLIAFDNVSNVAGTGIFVLGKI